MKPEHVAHAIETAHGGAIEEGSVGGGTGMICYEFKGGTGTASRPVAGIGAPALPAKQYTVGVLVQANCGRRPELTIRGLRSGGKFPAPFTRKRAAQLLSSLPLMPRCFHIN